jgi:hypothetical protein
MNPETRVRAEWPAPTWSKLAGLLGEAESPALAFKQMLGKTRRSLFSWVVPG